MIELSVCIGSTCHLKGSYNVIQQFQQLLEEKKLHHKVDFKAAFCMQQCKNEGVSISLAGLTYSVKPEETKFFFETQVIPMLTD